MEVQLVASILALIEKEKKFKIIQKHGKEWWIGILGLSFKGTYWTFQQQKLDRLISSSLCSAFPDGATVNPGGMFFPQPTQCGAGVKLR